jgi:energy-coupling factor transporter ATP-binding protein EcfA2
MAHDFSTAPLALPFARAPHHVIRSLTIEGGAHFRHVHLDLADGLNCLIGATGSGKTTLLQSLGFAIGVTPTDPRTPRNEAQVAGTLGAGRVLASVRTQHGQRYTTERRAGGEARVTGENGERATVSLDSDLFKIEIYAQNEIQNMAENPAAQLALIDKFSAAEIRDLDDRIAQVERRLTLNAAEIKRLDAEIADAGDRTGDLPSVAAALHALTEAAGPNADEATRAHEAKVLRGREQAALRGLRDELRIVLTAAGAFEVDARRRLGAPLSPALAASANRAVLDRAHAGSQAALAVLQDAVTRVRSALLSAESGVSTAGDILGAAHAGQDAAYDALNRQQDADRGRVAERARLQKQFLELESLEKKLSERRGERDVRASDAQTLRDERAGLLAMQLGVRRRVGNDITSVLEGRVEVTVVNGGDTEAYLALLFELLKGANIRSELVREIARSIRPDDLAAIVRANNPAPIQVIDEAKTNRVERAQKVVDALRASGMVSRLDVVRLRDVPLIKLRVNGRYVPTAELSFGQRCTAVLLILLIQSAAPLLIDQPEDQLDNAFIYEVLVPTLQTAKLSRQLIFATHNANIVVLGESDRVFVLDGEKSEGRLTEAGTIDEVQGGIERVVEGGSAAFLRRSHRYGHTAAP